MKTWDVYFAPVGVKLDTVKAERRWDALQDTARKFKADIDYLEAYEVDTPHERDREEQGVNEINAVVGVSREDDPSDVDEAYGEGTYKRLFPDTDEE
jgi:hypothetical protein